MIINCSRKAFQILQKNINSQQEEVWVLTLDNDLKLLELDLLFRGTVNECIIHPRDLIRTICARNASVFIVAHNHPSGKAKPSRQDRRVTQRILKISQLLEVPMRDHLIFSQNTYFSFADHGLLNRASRPGR